MNTIYWTHERIDYANDLHIVMPVYYVTEYGDNYWKTSGSLRQYYRDEPTLNDDGAIENHPGISTSFKSKVKTTEKIPATDAADTADCCQ